MNDETRSLLNSRGGCFETIMKFLVIIVAIIFILKML